VRRHAHALVIRRARVPSLLRSALRASLLSASLLGCALLPTSGLLGCAHSAESNGGDKYSGSAPADGSLERLAALDVTMLALAPAVADRPTEKQMWDELRARIADVRPAIRAGTAASKTLDDLELEVRELINRLHEQGVQVKAIESTHGLLAIVHSSEEAGIDLGGTRYSIGGWSTSGSDQRVELTRLLPAGSHVLRIEGQHEQRVFAAELSVPVREQSQTLVVCSTTSDGMALDLSCTVDGRLANSGPAPMGHSDEAQAMDLEPTAVGEPVAYGDAASLGEPTASGDAVDGTGAMAKEAIAAVTQGRSDVSSLREQLRAKKGLSADLASDIESSLASLDAELASVESRLLASDESASEVIEDGSLSRLHARLETLNILGKLVASLPE
jgi:hypothetical protein